MRAGGGGYISNACPRCGWFVPSLTAWPQWDGLHASPSGRAVLRQRVWGEAALIVRASAKALVIPYLVLQAGSHAGLPPSLSALLGFTYLVPWTLENLKLFRQIADPPTYRSHRRRGRPVAGAPATDMEADDHCAGSRARAAANANASIDPHDALFNILGGAPPRLFVTKGDTCAICLDPFPKETATIAASHVGAEAAGALAALEPPVVGLRCGHVLHVECATAAVRVAQRRHVRCPLCREPVTIAGAAAARAFS